MINSKGFKDLSFYKSEIKAIQQELKTLPAGYLVKQRAFYYEKRGTIQKGITKDQQKVMLLARKAYLLRKLEHMEWNYSLEKKLSGQYKTEDSMEIIQGLPSLYKTLPANYFFHRSVNDHLQNEAEENAGRPNELRYLTESGIKVRSKSERTIANTLDRNGIPYRYEVAIAMGGVVKYPDFTIFRPSDGRTLLWEHFGLMDQDVYRQNAVDKLSLYAQHGFFPFVNLICSYEQDLQDPARIIELIDFFRLRRI